MKSWLSTLAVAALMLPMGSIAMAQEDPKPGAQGEDQSMDGDKEETKERPKEEPRTEERRERRRGQGRMGRWMDRMGIPIDRMKEQLGLSAEQVEKFEAMNADIQKKMADFREKMAAGEFDPGSMRDMFRNGREEMQKKINEILTPEQQEKAKEMRQQQRSRWERGGRGQRGGGRNQLGKRLREEAVKALALSEEESAVVLPLLDGVLETRKLLNNENEKRRKNFLEKVRETTEGEALASLLADYRTSRDDDKETLKKSQDQLREVLTVEQEAKLVGLNLLD